MITRIFIFLSILISCSPNQKYFKFDFKEEKIIKFKTVLITPIDLVREKPNGSNYNSIKKIESIIEKYVKDNGFTITPNTVFVANWERESKKNNGFFNPMTGEIDGAKIGKCLMNAIVETRKELDFDAIIFTSLIKRSSKLAGDRVYWDGCSRKLKDENGDVITDMRWRGEMEGISLQIQIFDKNHNIVFQNIGAIEFPYELKKSYNKMTFAWKDSLEFNTEEINQGLKIAFHPFIIYDKFPKNPIFYED